MNVELKNSKKDPRGPVKIIAKDILRLLLSLGALLCVNDATYASAGGMKIIYQQVKYQQETIVRGKIVDTTGLPVANATVHIADSRISVTTDSIGNFSIAATGKLARLIISHIGYERQEVSISEDFMNIVLTREVRGMQEVVVVGYGKQKKEDITGAITQISGKALIDRPVANIGQALQGQVANLNVSTVADPGGSWSPAKFNVRGTTSINGGEPLVVVDGTPVDNINNLNTNDIESISVLKDASAAAIYGARASYGVVLITTKSGLKTGKTEVSIGSISGWSSYTHMPKPVSSVQYAQAYNDAAENSGLTHPFSAEFIGRLQRYIDDPASIPVTEPNPNDTTQWGWENAVDNVNYFKAFLKPYSFTQKIDASVRGGKKALNYFVSGAYYDLGGQLRYGDEKFNRYNLTSNVHVEPKSWLRLDAKLRYSRENLNIPYAYAEDQGNWFHLAGSRRPYWPRRNPDGTLSLISGLVAVKNGGRTIQNNNDLWLTGDLELEPVTNWLITADYSYNPTFNNSSDQYSKIWWTAVDGSRVYSSAPNWLNRQVKNEDYNSLNLYTSYHYQKQKHFFKILLGYQQEEEKLEILNGRRLDLITDLEPSLLLATGTQSAYDNLNDWATIGFFGRFNYNYNAKYLLEINARYDGTSRFPKGRQFGLFPSIGVGYNIAKEKFWPFKAGIDNFKLRASYGSLGNQTLGNLANSYSIYMPVYGVSTGIPYLFAGSDLMTYLSVPGIVNPSLTWETVNTFNFGLDASFLSGRLDVTFDRYRRNTLNMIGPAEALPQTLGASVPLTNNADLQTNGFELTLSWKDRIGDDLSYNVSFLLSDYQAYVKSYNNPTKILSTYYTGMKIGEIWGYETKGIFQSQDQLNKMPDQSFIYGRWNVGDIEYADLDGNNIINVGGNTATNPGDRRVIGNNTPRFSFGSNLGLSYKGIDFNLFLQGVMKRDLALNGTYFYGITAAYNEIWHNSLNYWRPDNTDAYWPKPYITGEYNKNRQTQTRYLQNGAYMRVKNMQLGYTLPPAILKRLALQQCRIYISGENLFTFSNIIEGFDPETAAIGSWGSGKVYPLMRTVSLGLNVKF